MSKKLFEHKDTINVEEVGMWQLVEKTEKCKEYCLSCAERMVTNFSRAPLDFLEEYKRISEELRDRDAVKCEDKCMLVKRSCPNVERLKFWEENGGKAVYTSDEKEEKKVSDPLTVNEYSRCVNGVKVFSNVLFELAHKPTKFRMDYYNMKTGQLLEEKEDDDDEDEIGEDPKKWANKDEISDVRVGASFDQELIKRWRMTKSERDDYRKEMRSNPAEAAEIVKEFGTGKNLERVRKVLEHQRGGILAEKEGDNAGGDKPVSGTAPRW